MNNELTTKKLDQYLVTNSSYYHKFIEKFNTKGNFNSFNLFALLLAPAWAAYRKMWFVYGGLFIFQIFMIIFFLIAERPNIPNYLDLILKLTIIIFALGAIRIVCLSNSLLLRKASKAKEHEIGKSSWYIVLLASIVFFLPASALTLNTYYPQYATYKNKISVQKTIKKKDVEFRIGDIELQEGMISSVLKQTKETIYFQPQSFLINNHLEDSFIGFQMGKPNLVFELTKEGEKLFQINSNKYKDKFIVVLFESKPLLVFKSNGEELGSKYLSIPVADTSDYGNLLSYLQGQKMIKNEHNNFLSWLYHNF